MFIQQTYGSSNKLIITGRDSRRKGWKHLTNSWLCDVGTEGQRNSQSKGRVGNTALWEETAIEVRGTLRRWQPIYKVKEVLARTQPRLSSSSDGIQEQLGQRHLASEATAAVRTAARASGQRQGVSRWPTASASLDSSVWATRVFCSSILPRCLRISITAELAFLMPSQAWEPQCTDPRRGSSSLHARCVSDLYVRDFMPLSEYFLTVYPSPQTPLVTLYEPLPPTPITLKQSGEVGCLHGNIPALGHFWIAGRVCPLKWLADPLRKPLKNLYKSYLLVSLILKMLFFFSFSLACKLL